AARNSSHVQVLAGSVGYSTFALSNKLLLMKRPAAVTSDGMVRTLPSWTVMRSLLILFSGLLAVALRSWSWLTQMVSREGTLAASGNELACAAWRSLSW